MGRICRARPEEDAAWSRSSRTSAIRDLSAGQPVGGNIWVALAWCVGILIVAYVFAMVIYRREIS